MDIDKLKKIAEKFNKKVEKKIKKLLRPSKSLLTLQLFWGEQQPAVAIAAAGCNFSGPNPCLPISHSPIRLSHSKSPPLPLR
jgi:hypothetical protein